MRRLTSALLACAALACAALAGAACGGDEASPEEYRTQARRICVEADRATKAIRQPTRTTPEAIADYFRRLLAPTERATQRFEELEPPEGLAPAHTEVVRAQREGIIAVENVVEQLEGDEDPRQVLAAAQDRIRTLSRRADAAAKRLGVPECGQ